MGIILNYYKRIQDKYKRSFGHLVYTYVQSRLQHKGRNIIDSYFINFEQNNFNNFPRVRLTNCDFYSFYEENYSL